MIGSNAFRNCSSSSISNFFATGVSGSGFVALTQLERLRELHLYFDLVDDAPIQVELSTLAGLPALEIVDVGGPYFEPEDVMPLRNCRSLKELRLWGGGFTDDTTAAWLAELTELVELNLGDNCVVTDAGARALAKLPKLQKLSVCGFVTAAGAKELIQAPSLRQLSIGSSNISSTDEAELRKRAPGVILAIRPYSGSVVLDRDGLPRKMRPDEDSMIVGHDGQMRQLLKNGGTLRSKVDSLEGKSAPPLKTENLNAEFEWPSVSGKIVLIDFWGTWCGPCRMQFPELQELYSKYHADGLEIIGVHTREGAEDLPAYLKEKSVPWKNIVDVDGEIATAYGVEHFPSLFLVNREGVLRVALVHPLGLEAAIVALLQEKD